MDVRFEEIHPFEEDVIRGIGPVAEYLGLNTKTIISKIQNGRFVPPIPEEDVEDSSWRVSDLDQWAEDHPSIGITVWAVQVLGKGLTEWIEVDRKDSKRAAVRIAEELKASLPLRAKHLRSIEKIQVCPVPALAGSISYA